MVFLFIGIVLICLPLFGLLVYGDPEYWKDNDDKKATQSNHQKNQKSGFLARFSEEMKRYDRVAKAPFEKNKEKKD